MSYSRLSHLPRQPLVIAITLLVLASVPCMAAFTGLTQIPTADTLSPGEYEIELELDRILPGFESEESIIGSEAGLGPRSEAGIDLSLDGEPDWRILPNYKYAISPITRTRPGLAVGFGPVVEEFVTSPYLTAGQDFGPFRGHAGVLHIEDSFEWFAGVDRALSKDVVLMADYISGSGNAVSVGMSFEMSDRYGLLVGVLFPNSSKDNTIVTLELDFGGRLGGHNPPEND